MITQRPKGTQDWYGENMHKRTLIEAMARELCKAYHIKEVITPVFEHAYCSSVVSVRQQTLYKKRCIPLKTKAEEALH